jgi:hypothetical protein
MNNNNFNQEERKMNTRKQYESLKSKVGKRKEPFNEFINMLENRTSWLTSPASTRFHLSEDGGLLKHSVGVTMNLLKFRNEFASKISEESCIVVGLFHDVGKVGMPGTPLYVPNDKEWEVKRGIRYCYNPDIVPMGIALRSLYLTTKYIPLSSSESQAIAYHDGQYIDENRIVAHKEEPLTLLLHWADYWTAHIHEEGRAFRSDDVYYQLQRIAS